jgi:hypothetical protein
MLGLERDSDGFLLQHDRYVHPSGNRNKGIYCAGGNKFENH